MGQLVAILNIFGSIASIVGLIATLNGIEAPITKEWLQYGLWASLGLSIYVLFVPSNPLAQNSAAKFKSFVPHISTDGSIHLQEGQFTMIGTRPITIRFETPFVEPPEIEIVDKGGCAGAYLPQVDNVTRFAFTVRRHMGRRKTNGDDYPDAFEWIATGTVLVDRTV